MKQAHISLVFRQPSAHILNFSYKAYDPKKCCKRHFAERLSRIDGTNAYWKFLNLFLVNRMTSSYKFSSEVSFFSC